MKPWQVVERIVDEGETEEDGNICEYWVQDDRADVIAVCTLRTAAEKIVREHNALSGWENPVWRNCQKCDGKGVNYSNHRTRSCYECEGTGLGKAAQAALRLAQKGD